MIKSTVIADSISPYGVRLTTLSLIYPRFILAELNTHRMLSRNSASSRAIPTATLIEEILDESAMPVSWGRNKKGMQATEELTADEILEAKFIWNKSRDEAINHAIRLVDLGLHKQIVNRILEPYMHSRTIVTATEWDNFYTLRRHKDAQPEIKALADTMWESMEKSEPEKKSSVDEWHLPYVTQHDPAGYRLQYSVARCARVSYLTHEGKKCNPTEDLKLFERLKNSGHWSPFEHQAFPCYRRTPCANFRGWTQYRFYIENYTNKMTDKKEMTSRCEQQR